MRSIPTLGLGLVLAAATGFPVAHAHNHEHEHATDAAQTAVPAGLAEAVAGSWRTPAYAARDPWRRPVQTLGFFGLKDSMTVIEITPGGGWYTEVLAPWLGKRGHYVAAIVDPDTATSEAAQAAYTRGKAALASVLEKLPANPDRVHIKPFTPATAEFAPAGSADAVLTFRNVHNWMMGGTVQTMFNGFFSALKPGGVLGVVEHRANQDVPEGDRSGYVSEAQVIAFATAAGFVLEARSEINANPKDSKDHPNGVWTLPPVNSHEPADAAKYQAIGESDRMTLRFRKPA